MLREWSKELGNPGDFERYLNEMHPLGYCPDADVVADACVFLASDKARFITGCILPVSGGAELGYKNNYLHFAVNTDRNNNEIPGKTISIS